MRVMQSTILNVVCLNDQVTIYYEEKNMLRMKNGKDVYGSNTRDTVDTNFAEYIPNYIREIVSVGDRRILEIFGKNR